MSEPEISMHNCESCKDTGLVYEESAQGGGYEEVFCFRCSAWKSLS